MPPSTESLAYLPITKLVPLPKNPRKGHRVGALAESIRAHGFGAAATVNRRTGHLIAGNGRLKALAALRRDGAAPPAGILTDAKGNWTVPVFFGNWDEADEPRVALALNGGLNDSLEGEIDKAVVAELLRAAESIDLAALGLVAEQAEQFLSDFEAPLVEPAMNLTGIETVATLPDECTLRVITSTKTAERFRRLTAKGIPAERILEDGLHQIETAHDAEASQATAQKSKRASARKKGRARRGRHSASA